MYFSNSSSFSTSSPSTSSSSSTESERHRKRSKKTKKKQVSGKKDSRNGRNNKHEDENKKQGASRKNKKRVKEKYNDLNDFLAKLKKEKLAKRRAAVFKSSASISKEKHEKGEKLEGKTKFLNELDSNRERIIKETPFFQVSPSTINHSITELAEETNLRLQKLTVLNNQIKEDNDLYLSNNVDDVCVGDNVHTVDEDFESNNITMDTSCQKTELATSRVNYDQSDVDLVASKEDISEQYRMPLKVDQQLQQEKQRNYQEYPVPLEQSISDLYLLAQDRVERELLADNKDFPEYVEKPDGSLSIENDYNQEFYELDQDGSSNNNVYNDGSEKDVYDEVQLENMRESSYEGIKNEGEGCGENNLVLDQEEENNIKENAIDRNDCEKDNNEMVLQNDWQQPELLKKEAEVEIKNVFQDEFENEEDTEEKRALKKRILTLRETIQRLRAELNDAKRAVEEEKRSIKLPGHVCNVLQPCTVAAQLEARLSARRKAAAASYCHGLHQVEQMVSQEMTRLEDDINKLQPLNQMAANWETPKDSEMTSIMYRHDYMLVAKQMDFNIPMELKTILHTAEFSPVM